MPPAPCFKVPIANRGRQFNCGNEGEEEEPDDNQSKRDGVRAKDGGMGAAAPDDDEEPHNNVPTTPFWPTTNALLPLLLTIASDEVDGTVEEEF
jgi:hypothetical protein